MTWKDNEDTLDLRERDILVQKHDGHSERIKYYYRCYDSLQYLMLFPFGEPGWHRGIECVNRSNWPPNKGQQRPVFPHNCSTVEELLNAESLVFVICCQLAAYSCIGDCSKLGFKAWCAACSKAHM
ncbi:uncharacterized protein LOC131329133 [Rhododendron vialii]|uniref:uncharacterized protein LOC131329133 n=1 Tax=Rhododendron vialii TaxID=182163 RepID=UPI00265FC9CD|nr:uncharacterized protein LOC131329133 [Rhododendron vialii]